jgi:hypothetical protein
LSSAIAPEVVAGLLERQVRPHPGDQLGLVEGLGHVVHRAGLERPYDECLFVGRRQEDDRYLGELGLRADQPADLESVHTGHQRIQEHQVNRLRHDPAQGVLAPGDRHGLEAALAEHRLKDPHVGLLVIHHEDSSGKFFVAHGCSCNAFATADL